MEAEKRLGKGNYTKKCGVVGVWGEGRGVIETDFVQSVMIANILWASLKF